MADDPDGVLAALQRGEERLETARQLAADGKLEEAEAILRALLVGRPPDAESYQWTLPWMLYEKVVAALGDAALPGLLEVLDVAREELDRAEVLYAIGEVGPAATVARARIEPFASDSENHVREAATRALEKIDGRQRTHAAQRAAAQHKAQEQAVALLDLGPLMERVGFFDLRVAARIEAALKLVPHRAAEPAFVDLAGMARDIRAAVLGPAEPPAGPSARLRFCDLLARLESIPDGKAWPIGPRIALIGSDATCTDVVLEGDPGVAPVHAALVPHAGRLTWVDLRRGGASAPRCRVLSDGDVLEVGSARFRVVIEHQPERAPEPDRVREILDRLMAFTRALGTGEPLDERLAAALTAIAAPRPRCVAWLLVPGAEGRAYCIPEKASRNLNSAREPALILRALLAWRRPVLARQPMQELSALWPVRTESELVGGLVLNVLDCGPCIGVPLTAPPGMVGLLVAGVCELNMDQAASGFAFQPADVLELDCAGRVLARVLTHERPGPAFPPAARADNGLVLRCGARAHPLDGRIILVGREAPCDVRVDHASASAQHAVLVPDGDGYTVLDLESTNGTRVNDKRARRRRLKPDDCIRVGSVELEVRATPAAESSARPAPHWADSTQLRRRLLDQLRTHPDRSGLTLLEQALGADEVTAQR